MFFVIAGAGPVSSTVVGHVKTCSIVALGWITSGRLVTANSAFGVLMAIASIFLYVSDCLLLLLMSRLMAVKVFSDRDADKNLVLRALISTLSETLQSRAIFTGGEMVRHLQVEIRFFRPRPHLYLPAASMWSILVSRFALVHHLKECFHNLHVENLVSS